jgi:hypothetical protein
VCAVLAKVRFAECGEAGADLSEPDYDDGVVASGDG